MRSDPTCLWTSQRLIPRMFDDVRAVRAWLAWRHIDRKLNLRAVWSGGEPPVLVSVKVLVNGGQCDAGLTAEATRALRALGWVEGPGRDDRGFWVPSDEPLSAHQRIEGIARVERVLRST